MLMGPGSRVGRADSFPEIQAKPVVSPEERPPLFLIYVELDNMERALRLHRGEQGLVCSLHRLRTCVHKGLIATVSPGSLGPAIEHSPWPFITVKSLEALSCFFLFYPPLLPYLQIRTGRRREGTSSLSQNHSTSGPPPGNPHLGTALVC